MVTRDLVFCSRCGYIVEQRPTYRMLGWYRSSFSICPFCHKVGVLRIGKARFDSTNSFNFVFPPAAHLRQRVLRREKRNSELE